MGRKLLYLMICALILCSAGIASAQDYQGGEAGSPAGSSFVGVILNFVTLLIICGCLLYAKRIESFLKGGELCLSWLLIFFSFLVLVFLELVKLGNSMSIFKFDSTFYAFFKLIWAILLGWGIHRLKQVLS